MNKTEADELLEIKFHEAGKSWENEIPLICRFRNRVNILHLCFMQKQTSM